MSSASHPSTLAADAKTNVGAADLYSLRPIACAVRFVDHDCMLGDSSRLAPMAIFLLGASACGGSALLHAPVADRCASAGLRGCDEIADGVVLVVDGNK